MYQMIYLLINKKFGLELVIIQKKRLIKCTIEWFINK